MKSGQLFWGFFLLTIGALFLLTRYDVIYTDFNFVWDIWPLIFVLWGAMVIFKEPVVRPAISALFGFFIALILFGIVANIFVSIDFDHFHDDYDSYSTTFDEDYNDSIKYVNFEFGSGAGTFQIGDETNKLLEGKAYGSLADYDYYTDIEDSLAIVHFDLHTKNFDLFDGKLRNHVELSLNRNPVYNLVLNIGAAKARFDFSNIKTREVTLHTGAANVKMKLGEKCDSTQVNVEMGAASLNMEIPQNSGCRLEGDMVLMPRSLEGFIKKDSGFYETPNFEKAGKKIFVRIDGGVSSLKVSKY